MKAFVSRTLKGIDSLEVADVPKPGPLGPGRVRIAVRAVSLNYRDLLVLSGGFAAMTLRNLIACSDGAGEVAEVAPDVSRVTVGDRVALTYNPYWIGGAWEPSAAALGRGGGLQGVMCEEVVVHESEVVVLPAHLSFEEGATLPCAAVTAWHALCGPAPLLPGMSVLSQGAGGVSIFVLQFAKLFGARVIMISSSPERCARLQKLGADETIDYCAEPEWDVAVRRLTGGMGVDVTVDIGGAATVARGFASTRLGGRISLVVRLTGIPDTGSAMMSGLDVMSIKTGSRQDFEAMNRAIAYHRLRPQIDSRYHFSQLPDALRHLQSGRHFGKIVVGVD